MKTISIAIVFLLVFSVSIFLFSKRDFPSKIIIDTQYCDTVKLPYPIIFLPGLGQKSDVWMEKGLFNYYDTLNIGYGGNIECSTESLNTECTLSKENISNGTTNDYFTVSFSNPEASVKNLSKELEKLIELVLDLTGTESVILIGYSYGGLIGRQYLVDRINDHKVKRLVTIGTPHLGSSYAYIWKVKKSVLHMYEELLKMERDDEKNTSSIDFYIDHIVYSSQLEFWEKLLKNIELLEKEIGINFDSDAIYDLLPTNVDPFFNNNFFDFLNTGPNCLTQIENSPHPTDVEYISIISQVDIHKEFSKGNVVAVMELFRKGISLYSGGDFFQEGDGVVSTKSQNISNVPWFKKNIKHSISNTILLETEHSEHINKNLEILKNSLSNKPTIKQVNLYRDNSGFIYIEILFDEYLPLNGCKVDVKITDSNEFNEIFTADKAQIKLVKVKKSIFSSVKIKLLNKRNFRNSNNVDIELINKFGKKAEFHMVVHKTKLRDLPFHT
jgi:pimeloyl-ACP methyl ester carboxylesterase